jgi:hypothetical protein
MLMMREMDFSPHTHTHTYSRVYTVYTFIVIIYSSHPLTLDGNKNDVCRWF